MANILLLNGPNINLLGSREPQVYGDKRLVDVEQTLQSQGKQAGHTLSCQQYNGEGELVSAIQQCKSQLIILNAGAYTHTSIAIRDSLKAVNIPFIEVHISNVFARESYRQQSYLSDIAIGVIVGFGVFGYELALQAACHYLATHH